MNSWLPNFQQNLSQTVNGFISVFSDSTTTPTTNYPTILENLDSDPAARGLLWRLSLGYLPLECPLDVSKSLPRLSLWKESLQKSRSSYRIHCITIFSWEHADYASRLLQRFKAKSEGGHGLSPSLISTDLSQDDKDLINIIVKDVLRTHPLFNWFHQFHGIKDDIFDPYWRPDFSLVRMLFIFGKINPKIKYAQGLNEVLAPFLFVFGMDPSSISPDLFYFPSGKAMINTGSSSTSVPTRPAGMHDFPKTPQSGLNTERTSNIVFDDEDEFDSILSSVNPIEADSFFCFCSLMSDTFMTNHYFRQLDHTADGIQGTMNQLTRLLKSLDPDVANQLKRQKVEPIYFSYRWITVLFMQDIFLPNSLQIWDTFLLSGSHLSIPNHIRHLINSRLDLNSQPILSKISGSRQKYLIQASLPLFDRIQFILNLCCVFIISRRKTILQGDLGSIISCLQNLEIRNVFPYLVHVVQILTATLANNSVPQLSPERLLAIASIEKPLSPLINPKNIKNQHSIKVMSSEPKSSKSSKLGSSPSIPTKKYPPSKPRSAPSKPGSASSSSNTTS